jgi:hypothetical protein
VANFETGEPKLRQTSLGYRQATGSEQGEDLNAAGTQGISDRET